MAGEVEHAEEDDEERVTAAAEPNRVPVLRDRREHCSDGRVVGDVWSRPYPRRHRGYRVLKARGEVVRADRAPAEPLRRRTPGEPGQELLDRGRRRRQRLVPGGGAPRDEPAPVRLEQNLHVGPGCG